MCALGDSMDAERTELAWTFTPADLFEAPYEGTQGGAHLSITNGRAIVTLNGSQPAPAAEEDLRQWVLSVLRVRAIQTGRSFELKGTATATEFKDGKSHIFVRVEPAVLRITAGRLEQIRPTGKRCARDRGKASWEAPGRAAPSELRGTGDDAAAREGMDPEIRRSSVAIGLRLSHAGTGRLTCVRPPRIWRR